MRTRSRSDAALVAAVFTGSLLALTVPVALGADPARLPVRAAAAGADLEAQTRAATLELYALETRLGRARAGLAGITSRRAAIERERILIDRRLTLAQTALKVSQDRLGEVLRALYQQGDAADPLEIVLGAGSLDEAMAGLDGLDRAAAQSSAIIAQTRAARLRLAAERTRLASRVAELDELAVSARMEANELGAAVAEREAFVAGLRHRQELNAARIGSIEAQARAAGTRALATSPVTPTAAAPAATAPPVRAVPAGNTLTVTSTGYALRGRTSSGMPTGPGVVAVDPSVIPLGTRLLVPGYGEAVAADTGGAVLGNTIDLWFPTLEQAHAWGRRTVTITLR